MKKCNECEMIKTNGWNNMKKDETLVDQFFDHNAIKLVSSDSGWTESFDIYYCETCHNVFNLYTFSPPEDGEELEYSVFCITDDMEDDYNIGFLENVGSYLYLKEKNEKIQNLKKEDGDITVYLSAHVDQLKKLKEGKEIKCSDLRSDLYLDFQELLCRFWQVRWFINCRYYIKVKIPKSSLKTSIETQVSNLGSGHGGFELKSNYKVKVDDISVFDPYKSHFVSLNDWTVPPVYDQSAPEVDRYFELYEPIKELYKPMYEEDIAKEKRKEKELLSALYGNIFSK